MVRADQSFSEVKFQLRVLSKAFNAQNKKWVNVDKWLINNSISIKKCSNNPNNGCLCCEVLDCSPVFVSNVTGKQFILPKGSFNCKSTNIIYLITCSDCGIQYVGQTIQPLHIRLNAHRSCALHKSSTFLYQHFNGTDHHNFDNATIQIIDCLDVEDESSGLDQIENFWISTLCTAYPLGLNDRLDGTGNVSNQKSDLSKAYFCSPIARRKRGHGRRKKDKRQDILHNNTQHYDSTTINNIVLELANLFHIDTSFFFVRLRSLRKKLLQCIVRKAVNDNLSIMPILQSFLFNTFCSNTTIVKKAKREHIIFPFASKFIDQLHLNSIIHDTSIMSLLPKELNDKLPLRIFYKFNTPIGRKILNYSTFLKQLTKDDISSILSEDCACSSSPYNYTPHAHIITGDLNIVTNTKLRRLMSFGAKFREPVNMEPSKLKDILFSYVESFVSQKSAKYHLGPEFFKAWENRVKTVIENRINFFMRYKPEVFLGGQSLLHDEEVSDYLNKLHKKFIIVVADKAANNFVFVCKKYYISVLLHELGIDPNTLTCNGNTTYSFHSENKVSVIAKTVKDMKELFGITCPDAHLRIPNIFWNAKLHKVPYKPRFIAGARFSATKQLEILLNKCLLLLRNHFASYCKVIYQRTGINCNWSIGSSSQFLEKIKNVQVWTMQVYDFSTLYTTLDLHDVENTLFGLCDLLFSSKHKYICVNSFKACFSTKKRNGYTSFDLTLFKKAISFILHNTFVAFADFVLKQGKGIPMGGSCSSPTADLYLSFKEFTYMKTLLREKKFNLARLLSNNSRYIDDVNIINYQHFFEQSKNIYPPDLSLERSGQDDRNAVYLDVRITVGNNGLITTVYNKTDDFNFDVVNFTFPESNIPEQLGYNVFYGQILRYSTIFSSRIDFILKSSTLFHTLRSRGYRHSSLLKYLKRVLGKNIFILHKYGFSNSDEVVRDLLRTLT